MIIWFITVHDVDIMQVLSIWHGCTKARNLLISLSLIHILAKPAQNIDRLAIDAKADGNFYADYFLNMAVEGARVHTVITDAKMCIRDRWKISWIWSIRRHG